MDSTVKTNDTGSQERFASHTPGPWEYGQAHNYYGFYIAPKGRLPTLAAIEEGKPHVHAFNYPGATEANARLIAAAPELLETLEAVLDRMGALSNRSELESFMGSQADADRILSVIAKARYSEQRSSASGGPTKAQAE